MADKQSTVTTAAEDLANELPPALQLFRPSAQALGRNWHVFAALYAVPIAIVGGALVILLSAANALPTPRDIFMVVGVLAALAGVYMILVSLPGLTYAALQSARDESVDYAEALAAARHYFWRLWGTRICTAVITLVGFVLLIVPGLFAMRALLFAQYLVIDKNLPVFEAMRASRALSQKYSRAAWGVVGAQMLLFLLGFIPFLGSVISLVGGASYYCAPAVRYEQLMQLEAKLEAAKKPRRKRATNKKS